MKGQDGPSLCFSLPASRIMVRDCHVGPKWAFSITGSFSIWGQHWSFLEEESTLRSCVNL